MNEIVNPIQLNELIETIRIAVRRRDYAGGELEIAKAMRDHCLLYTSSMIVILLKISAAEIRLL